MVMGMLESEEVHDALANLLADLSHRRLLVSLGEYADEEALEFYSNLEDEAYWMAKGVDKLDVVALLARILEDNRIDDALKAKFILLAAAVLKS